jgi:hypothetical protein
MNVEKESVKKKKKKTTEKMFKKKNIFPTPYYTIGAV